MKSFATILSVTLALCTGVAHAQLYKWVGPDGKVTYSDTPPPAAAAKVETKPVAAARDSAAALPYELAQAVRKHPVILYTTSNCIPCDDARTLLNERGVPFTEKTVSTNEDIAELRKAGGDGNLPLLTVGRAPQRGFEPGAWHTALSAAGYPATSQLPKSWRNPLPESAARVQAPAAAPVASASERDEAQEARETPRPTDLPPPGGNAPPGFRF